MLFYCYLSKTKVLCGSVDTYKYQVCLLTIIAAKLFWNQPLVFDAAAQVKVNQGLSF